MKKEIEGLDRTEKEAIFRIETSWERKGRMQGRIEGRNEGRAEGKIEGKIEGKLEERVTVARRMLAHGMSIVDIATFTDLTYDEVEALKRS